MSIALKAFITGALGAVGDKFDEERQATTASLANRTKNAYINYQTYQEQTAALKEEIKKRDSLATSYQEDLTEDERIAIGSDSSNVFLSSYEKVLNAGNPNNRTLRDFIKKKEGASPQNYADWVQASTSKQPDPVAPSLEGSSSFFGTSAAVQRGELDRAAGSVGLSTDQLMAFEKKPDMPMLTPTASLNAEALTMPKSIEDRIEGLRNSLVDATPEEAAAIKENIDKLIGHQNVGLSPKTLTADADRIAMLLKNATGQEEVALKAELAKVNGLIRSNGAAQAQEKVRATAFGGSPRTFNETLKLVEMAQVSALSKSFGLNALKEGKMIEIITEADGSTRERSRSPRAGDAKEFTIVSDKAAIDYLTQMGHIKPDGSMSDYAKSILIAKGINLGAQPTPTEEKADPADPAAPAAPAPAVGLPQPKTQAEYDAIPTNTEYRDTDGKIKRKK